MLSDDAYEVTVYDGTVTEINITSTYNGKKVTSIGYHTFARTNLKIIYCEADSQPDGWDREWSNGCSATVVFGYTGE